MSFRHFPQLWLFSFFSGLCICVLLCHFPSIIFLDGLWRFNRDLMRRWIFVGFGLVWVFVCFVVVLLRLPAVSFD